MRSKQSMRNVTCVHLGHSTSKTIWMEHCFLPEGSEVGGKWWLLCLLPGRHTVWMSEKPRIAVFMCNQISAQSQQCNLSVPLLLRRSCSISLSRRELWLDREHTVGRRGKKETNNGGFNLFLSEVPWFLTLPMLGQLSSKAQGCKVIWKPFKPCHFGNHWIGLR